MDLAPRAGSHDVDAVVGALPTTRYRGSKRRFAAEIGGAICQVRPHRLFDAFGGSGVVSAIADQLGVQSQYSDLFHWTSRCARTLLQHEYSKQDLRTCLAAVESATEDPHAGFVSQTFRGCYFKPRENQELDGLLELSSTLPLVRRRDLIFYGIAQASLAKLPMSMFHRACLTQRVTPVAHRSGNLVTWNTPFRQLVPRFIREAVMFGWSRRLRHAVVQGDAVDVIESLTPQDVLFLDPPYVSADRTAPSYSEAYHFIEGFSLGELRWRRELDFSRSHPVFLGGPESSFDSSDGWIDGMSTLLDHSRGATVIATARERDEPGARQLRRMLRDRFATITRQNIGRTTIFSENPNAEMLFVAS